jgi:hypothetical protein
MRWRTEPAARCHSAPPHPPPPPPSRILYEPQREENRELQASRCRHLEGMLQTTQRATVP